MKIQKSFCTGMLPPGEGNPRNSEGAFLTLEDGRIAQQGTSEQLLAQDGLFRDLFNIQSAQKQEVQA